MRMFDECPDPTGRLLLALSARNVFDDRSDAEAMPRRQ
jgi:hypothetical protein